MKRKLGIVCDCIKKSSPVDNLDVIKDVGFDCFFSDVYDIKSVSALKNKAEKLGLDYEFIHTPYSPVNQMWLDGEGYLETVNSVKECIDSASLNNVSGVNMHVSSGWTPPAVCELGLSRFDTLVDYAVKKGVLLAFENLRLPEYLNVILDRYKSVSSVVFCYDCGHENCFSPDYPVMKKFGHRIKYTHFHDNFGKNDNPILDLHMLPFDGNLDYKKVIDSLDEFSYNGSIMLETFDSPHGHGGYENPLNGKAFVEEAFLRATRLNKLSKN